MADFTFLMFALKCYFDTILCFCIQSRDWQFVSDCGRSCSWYSHPGEACTSRATVNKFEYGFEAWETWAEYNGMNISFPITITPCYLCGIGYATQYTVTLVVSGS